MEELKNISIRGRMAYLISSFETYCCIITAIKKNGGGC